MASRSTSRSCSARSAPRRARTASRSARRPCPDTIEDAVLARLAPPVARGAGGRPGRRDHRPVLRARGPGRDHGRAARGARRAAPGARSTTTSSSRPGSAASYDFRHQLLRDAIYRSVPVGDRRRYHARAGEFGAQLEGHRRSMHRSTSSAPGFDAGRSRPRCPARASRHACPPTARRSSSIAAPSTTCPPTSIPPSERRSWTRRRTRRPTSRTTRSAISWPRAAAEAHRAAGDPVAAISSTLTVVNIDRRECGPTCRAPRRVARDWSASSTACPSRTPSKHGPRRRRAVRRHLARPIDATSPRPGRPSHSPARLGDEVGEPGVRDDGRLEGRRAGRHRRRRRGRRLARSARSPIAAERDGLRSDRRVQLSRRGADGGDRPWTTARRGTGYDGPALRRLHRAVPLRARDARDIGAGVLGATAMGRRRRPRRARRWPTGVAGGPASLPATRSASRRWVAATWREAEAILTPALELGEASRRRSR